jgi:uncharacterized delta-60 repeat protein
LPSCFIERLECRVQLSTVQYGVCASGDPSETGVLAETGPGLKDLGAKGVRLFTNSSFLSSDFDVTASGKVYVRNPSLATSLSYARQYHDAGYAVTWCVQLSIDRSMQDGSLLTNPDTGKARKLLATELRSPKAFRSWYDTLSKAQISKTDRTSVTRVVDIWEIGNEVNISSYWPVDPSTSGIDRVKTMLDSYVDHQLIPAYDVLSSINEPVAGAPVTSGTLEMFNHLNNQRGSRFHQYSDHCDYLNFHPYGVLGTPIEGFTPQDVINAFTLAMYGDGKVNKPFIISEYNLSDLHYAYPLDPSPNPRDAADAYGWVKNLDDARNAMLANPDVKEHCEWIHFYRLFADGRKPRGGLMFPPRSGSGAYTPMNPQYDMFKRWATGASTAVRAVSGNGFVNLNQARPAHAAVVQKDGKTLVLSDDGVRRYNTNGKIDSSYGVSGFVSIPLVGKTAALQGDGNLIVAGSINDEAMRNGYHLIVTRLSTGGRIDRSFATRGYYEMPVGSGSQARTLAMRDGKIIVAGHTGHLRNGVVVKLDLAGTPDPTFGDAGVAVVKTGGPIVDLSISKKGAITGLVNPYTIVPQTLLMRLGASGAPDTTFSGDGLGEIHLITGDGFFVGSDGAITLIGHAPLAERPVAVRYTTAGKIDTTFGESGVQKIGGKKFIRAITLDAPNGSRYLIGSIASSITSDVKRAFVSRLTSDCQIDTAYGTGGVRMLTSPNVQDVAFAVGYSTASVFAGPVDQLVVIAATFTGRGNLNLSQEWIRTLA